MGPRLGSGREAEIFAWGDGRVLRLLRDPGGRDRLEREAATMTAARHAGVPVPTVYELIVVEGRPGLVMDRIDGADGLTALARRPWTFARAARELSRLQARLHDVTAPPDTPDLREMLGDRIDSAPHLPAPARAYARDLLASLPDGDRICHGDFHPGNVIVDRTGPVIIDWTNAARGDPEADLARTVLLLRVGQPPDDLSNVARVTDRLGRSLFRHLWVHGYRRARAVDAGTMRSWESVCAAARLSEGIDEEVASLLRLLDERARASS